mmetsp:Transcript_6742/g.6059  ORF Transcript_6742/g.6059 Transcript_6742/m.6059 type:complete len:81 (-) Transcript_6742:507-749(-)
MGKTSQLSLQIDYYAVDLYAIGVTILKLVEPKLKYEKLFHYRDNYFKEEFSEEVYNAVSSLTSKDPEVRVNAAKEILENI